MVQETTAQDTVKRIKPTIRSRLLLAVNLPLAVLATFFLAYDYSQELARRVENKRIALEEEAKTLLPAVVRLRPHGLSRVQEFIDEVCIRMQDSESPGHHIAIELGSEIHQASSHHRASRDMFSAMQEAANSPDSQTSFGETELILGVYEKDGAAVYVSEELGSLSRISQKRHAEAAHWISDTGLSRRHSCQLSALSCRQSAA